MNIIIKEPVKRTCDCCGYQTLITNDICEVCPVCLWEDEYFHINGVFKFSEANGMTLHQAQQNYLKYGCYTSHKFSLCRNPREDETKDPRWLTIQDKIEKKYTNTQKTLSTIEKLIGRLKQADAPQMFLLYQKLINYRADNAKGLIAPPKSHPNFFFYQTLLESLAINLIKKDSDKFLELFIGFYNKGLCYYIGWSILLSILLKFDELQRSDAVLVSMIEIEINDYYGLNTLEKDLKEYWKKISFHSNDHFLIPAISN